MKTLDSEIINLKIHKFQINITEVVQLHIGIPFIQGTLNEEDEHILDYSITKGSEQYCFWPSLGGVDCLVKEKQLPLKIV